MNLTHENTNKRRGIYISEQLEADVVEFARRHKISFNEAARTGLMALLELERRGVTVRHTGIELVGKLPASL